MEKTTIAKQFRTIAVEGHIVTAEEAEFLIARAEKVEAKARTKSNKPSKNQLSNAKHAEEIADVLTDELQDINAIQAQVNSLAGFSNQKMSALMKALVDNGTAVKELVKGKAHYRRA